MAKQGRLLILGVVLICLVLMATGVRSLQADSVLLRLTDNPATDVRPMWSPDEQTIAFQSNRNGSFSIWLMDAGGGNQREILPGESDDRHPAWSPDGTQLAFDSDASGRREIWVIERDGQNLRQLTSLDALSNFPSWSPDGSKIAFYMYQDGIMDIWTMNADGSNPQPLTSELASERREQCTFACHQAAWSPDGQEIAYAGGEHHGIWLVGVDDGTTRELVSDDEHNHFPRFTSDGNLIYITEHIQSDEVWTDAWLFDPESGNTTLILDRMRLQGPFEWNKDRTKVLFHSPRSGNFDIYLADLATEAGRQALQTISGHVTASSDHPGAELEAADAEAEASEAEETTPTEAEPTSAEAQSQPAEGVPPTAPNEAEAATSSGSALSVVVIIVGLVSLGVIGVIAVILVMRRKRSV